MDIGIKGKFALITGGSHGIGRAIAIALADEGCNVAVCARDKKRLDEVSGQLKQRNVKSMVISADVLILSDIDRVMDEVTRNWGEIHILVNNVGGGGRWGSPVVEETAENVWREVYDKNAMAAVRFTMRAIPIMRKQKWGRVVSISSIYGREGGGRPWFNMAKAAEISLMKTLSMNPDLAGDGLTFNSVAPGAIMIEDTGWEQLKKENPREFEKFVSQLPLGRLGTPQEVASIVVFLCSQKAAFINGVSITADGGESRSF
jgi:3-oxoacyl-[acyl-carrier protein] reductase